jgi:hypothetical protein
MPALSKNYENKLKHYWKRPTKSMNVTRWLDMRLRAMFRPLLGLIFNSESRNHNKFKSLFLLLHFLAHRVDLITLI